MTLNASDIRRHLEDDSHITWVLAKRLLADTMESCVDGRGELGIIGTPGGNAGEFLLALAAAESASGQTIDAARVPGYFEAYLSAFGRFYMHSDTHALAHLPNDLLTHAQSGETEAERLGNFLRNPPAELSGRLLDELIQPQHIGCGHIKLMLTRPDDYGVRPELVRAFLDAFFRSLWAGAEVDFVVLEGDHQEGAVVNVVVEGEVIGETPIPTITPRVNGKQMFVNHPQAVNFLRKELANGIGGILPVQVQPQTLLTTIEELAQKQLGHTLTALAHGLPLFEVRFSNADTPPQVSQLGEVA